MTAILLALNLTLLVAQMSTTQQAADAAAKERSRKAAQSQFTENFRELQLLGIGLLKAHEAGSLVPARLSRDVKAIQRRARNLRGLLVLGAPGPVTARIDREMRSPEEFDRAIHLLSKLVSDFAHNPIHKNTKIFDTDQATRAATDLIAMIDLAKVIERRARDYARSS
ncbi:MAG: hypothetical protein ABI882_13105 [Acidobacteriota bacterium]